jgi:HK97 family phage portal protein
VDAQRHPLEALLDAPNPYLSRFELLEQTVGMLELTGNAYWFIAAGEDGLPAQIWPLRPDRVTVQPDPLRYVRGYVYEVDGRRIPLEPAEVVHFKRWHPANDYYGLSALDAGRLAISSDRAMAEWNRSTFGQDHGVPAGVVSVPPTITDADFERLKRDWRSTYGGGVKRTAFLRGNDIRWQNIGLSHTDLDFLKGRQAHRDEILSLFGIPVGLIDANATEANATVAERMFIERTLYPKLVRIAQKITQELLPFWAGSYVAEFDDIRPTDTHARLEEIRAAYPVLSINEIRARFYGMSPVAWGDLPVEGVAAEGRFNTDPAPHSPFSSNGKPTSHPDSVGTPFMASDSVPSDAEPAPDPIKAALAELAQWERFTLKRFMRPGGNASRRPFAVRALPEDIALDVARGLIGADTLEAAREVFKTARGLLKQPTGDVNLETDVGEDSNAESL